MIRLALDTSSLACTVALRVGDALYERHVEEPRAHTRLLMPMIRDVLEEANVELPDLDGIVLGNGPGSFIGLRIAASVSQGLAFGAGLPVIPVSSLAAVAAEVLAVSDANNVAVAQDAHMNQVYLGVYSRSSNHYPQPLGEEYLQGPGAIARLAELDRSQTAAAGQGWLRYPELFAANRSYFRGEPGVLYPKAAYLLDLSDRASSIRPEEIAPAYLRHKVAEKAAR